jgi:hypothetical protein
MHAAQSARISKRVLDIMRAPPHDDVDARCASLKLPSLCWSTSPIMSLIKPQHQCHSFNDMAVLMQHQAGSQPHSQPLRDMLKPTAKLLQPLRDKPLAQRIPATDASTTIELAASCR